MNISEAKQVMLKTHLAALDRGTRASALYLESGPGIGKSDGTRQSAAEMAKALKQPVGLHIEMLASVFSADVRGFMLPDKSPDGVLYSKYSRAPWYPTTRLGPHNMVFTPDGVCHRHGLWDGPVPAVGIEFLDEFAQADDEVKKPAAELLYNGAVGDTELPPGWRVIAAGNRLSDRSGALRELMFIVSRRCKLSIQASCPAWLEWANSQAPADRPHYLSLSFAQKNPDLVFRDAIPPGTEPFCTPRTLCLMDRDLSALRSEKDVTMDRLPTDSVSREVMQGWIGKGEAAQFITHLKYADELPDVIDIERDPRKAKLPPNRDAQMVCGYMLAHNTTEKNAPAMVDYLSRLHIEMQVLSVKAIMAQQERARHITQVPAFVQWLVKHKDVLLASRS